MHAWGRLAQFVTSEEFKGCLVSNKIADPLLVQLSPFEGTNFTFSPLRLPLSPNPDLAPVLTLLYAYFAVEPILPFPRLVYLPNSTHLFFFQPSQLCSSLSHRHSIWYLSAGNNPGSGPTPSVLSTVLQGEMLILALISWIPCPVFLVFTKESF